MRYLNILRHRALFIMDPHQQRKNPLPVSPQPRVPVLPLLHVQIGTEAPECRRQVPRGLEILPAIHDEHVRYPRPALGVRPSPLRDRVCVDAG